MTYGAHGASGTPRASGAHGTLETI